jgi:hypothetical protein
MRFNSPMLGDRSASTCHAVLLLLTAIVACGEPTTPWPEHGLTLHGALNATDTIGARLPQPVIVAIRDGIGRPIAGTVIQFYSLRSPNLLPLALMQSPVDGSLVTSLSLTTGADGSVAVRVTLGDVAGPAGIVVQRADAPAYADTVRFTTLPGATTSISATPKDTAVLPGKTYSVNAVVFDRKRNVVLQTPAYRALDASISLSSSRQVTTTTIARSGVVVSAGTRVVDTAWVSVVPTGTMAIRQGLTVKVVKLDGERVADVSVPTGSVIPGLPIAGPEWTPDGKAFYTTLGSQSDRKPGLFRIDLAGTQTLVGSCSGQGCSQDPSVFRMPASMSSYSVASDGHTLYLSGSVCNYSGILYRAQLGLSALAERLSPPNANDCFETGHRWPSISPDGSTLAFENDSSPGFMIQFIDLATRTRRPLWFAGQRPRWSPLGDQVAFVNQKTVWLRRPDGTGLRRLTSNWPYLPGVTWSSDGRWLLAHATIRAQPTVVVVEVATGLELPLGFTHAWYDSEYGEPVPAWRPGS